VTKTDLATFRELLRARQIELSGKSLSLERIAIERSADELDEAEYKSLREMAIAGLNRESAMRRSIELALRRITDRSFGVCVHCGEEVKRRRLEACPGPHSASAVRKRPIAAKRVFSKVSSRRFSMRRNSQLVSVHLRKVISRSPLTVVDVTPDLDGLNSEIGLL
jgi:DnaK suppressor protein